MRVIKVKVKVLRKLIREEYDILGGKKLPKKGEDGYERYYTLFHENGYTVHDREQNQKTVFKGKKTDYTGEEAKKIAYKLNQKSTNESTDLKESGEGIYQIQWMDGDDIIRKTANSFEEMIALYKKPNRRGLPIRIKHPGEKLWRLNAKWQQAFRKEVWQSK